MAVSVFTSDNERVEHTTATRWHIDELGTLHILGRIPRADGVVSRVNGADSHNIAAYAAGRWESAHVVRDDVVSAEKVYRRITDTSTSPEQAVEIIRRALTESVE